MVLATSHRRDLADRAGRADRGRWRLAPGAAAGRGDRADPAGDPADQPGRRRAARRAGRAGRRRASRSGCGPPALHRGLPAFDRPEILEAELSGLALDCAAWGTRPPRCRSPTRRRPARWRRRTRCCRSWARWTRTGGITALGRRMAAAGRASPARGDDAVGGRAGRPRWRPTWRRCWRSATRCARRSVRRHRPAPRASRARRRRRPGRGVAHPPGRRAVPPPPAHPAGAPTATRRRCWPPPSPTASPSAAASRARSGCPAAAAPSCRSAIRWPAPAAGGRGLDLKAGARIRLAAPLDLDALPRRWRRA